MSNYMDINGNLDDSGDWPDAYLCEGGDGHGLFVYGVCQDCGFEGDDEGRGQPDFMFEHDSSMASVGWGTDEDYGYFGGDDEY
jgi:hypothetical protein